MKNVLLSFMLLLCCGQLDAQLPYNKLPGYLSANRQWVVPDSIGIDVGTGQYLTYTTAISVTGNYPSSMAAAAHPANGSLLFYTMNGQVWNRDHKQMKGGVGLKGNTGGMTGSRQCVRIAPLITDGNKYYVFSLVPAFGLQPADDTVRYSKKDSFALFYSIVDMNLDGGKGEILPNLRNMPVSPARKRYGDGLLLVPGNCEDYWLVVHRSDSSIYEAWHIDYKGISTEPVVSRTGIPLSPLLMLQGNIFASLFGTTGYFSFFSGSFSLSSDRRLIKYQSSFLQTGSIPFSSIAQFDPATGKVSDELGFVFNPGATIDSLKYAGVNAAAFSPDNKMLYTLEQDTAKNCVLFQYDVSSYSMDSISTSKTFISYVTFYDSKRENLRLYNDTIYVSDAANRMIGIIARPNEKGVNCSFNARYIELPAGKNIDHFSSLPTDVVYPFRREDTFASRMDTMICRKLDTLLLTPRYDSYASGYLWNNGYADQALKIHEVGDYWVQSTSGCGIAVDSFHIRLDSLEHPVIRYAYGRLQTQQEYSAYQWLFNDSVLIPGADDYMCEPEEYGEYCVMVQSEAGCTDTSETYVHKYADSGLYAGSEKIPSVFMPGPNPTTGLLYFPGGVVARVLLYDVYGRQKADFGYVRKINIGSYPDGVYLVKLVTAAGKILFTGKIIKKS